MLQLASAKRGQDGKTPLNTNPTKPIQGAPLALRACALRASELLPAGVVITNPSVLVFMGSDFRPGRSTGKCGAA